MDWRELHLTRRSRAFNTAFRWLKVVAIVVGLPATTICLMAILGKVTGSIQIRGGVAVALALGVPGLVAWTFQPRGDPLVAVGMPSEMYALFLLGFAVLFVIGLHAQARPLLIREGDRAACEGQPEVARVAWFLGGVRASAPPCGALAR